MPIFLFILLLKFYFCHFHGTRICTKTPCNKNFRNKIFVLNVFGCFIRVFTMKNMVLLNRRTFLANKCFLIVSMKPETFCFFLKEVMPYCTKLYSIYFSVPLSTKIIIHIKSLHFILNNSSPITRDEFNHHLN